MKKSLAAVMAGIIVVVIGSFIYLNVFSKKAVAPSPKITSFEECVDAGYSVQESYPRKCITREGQSFTEEIGNVIDKQNLIKLTTPTPNAIVKSPLNISGEARGVWYFEASFPVKILDANGKVLGTAIASTTSDWMTDNFVPFTATLTFEEPTTAKGTLVLEKDNPSGLPENADSLRIPLKFK